MTKEHAGELVRAILSEDAEKIYDALMVAFPEAPPIPVDPNAGRCKSNAWSEKTGNVRCVLKHGHYPLTPCDFGIKAES